MTPDPFEQYADLYERWFERNHVAYESELRAVASLLPADGVGIEIGVGTGRFAAPLGVRLGVEPSEPMAEIARQRGIEVVQGVAESLPFADARFDFALMVVTLCFVDDAPLSLREAYRVLKDGGSLIVGFIDRESRWGRRYQSRKADSLFYRDARFYSVEEVFRLMESAGFRDFSSVQTLFQDGAENRTAEPVRAGQGQGSFVVLRGTKAQQESDRKISS
jgi:SAM-dependent methyltransferase